MVTGIRRQTGHLQACAAVPRSGSRKTTGFSMNARHSADGSPQVWHGTTILTVRKGGRVVIGGDGQVSIGQTVIKSNAKKVRKLGKGDVIGGLGRGHAAAC